MNENAELLEFKSRNEFRKWLKTNNKKDKGIWILFQKGSTDFSANDALEESICFGWIDGLMKSIDTKTYKKYFSKRKDVNKWSKKNKLIYEKMINNGLMTKEGIEVFKPKATTTNSIMDINEKIQILRNVLKENKDILILYDGKTASRQKQFAGFYCDAKTEETKEKRKKKIMDALMNNYNGMLY